MTFETTADIKMINCKIVLLFLVGILVVTPVRAKDKPKCKAPHELTFRAHVSEWGQTYHASYRVQYDKHNKRVVMFEDEHHGRVESHREFLFLHQVYMGFDVNFEKKTCKMFQIGKFRPLEVPGNATYHGQFDIGGPQNTVTVERWSLKEDSGRENVHLDVTIGHCYPVSQFVADKKNINKSVLTHIFDLVVGIVEPNEFQVPHLCKKGAPTLSVGSITPEANLAMSTYSRTLHN